MKTAHVALLVSGLFLVATAPAFAASKQKKLSTDISFSGSSVDGKYHSAGDAVAEVDQEKYLNSLIGMRKNFHDRLADERANLKGTTP